MLILIADDDKVFESMVLEFLESRGHQVVAVEEGGELIAEAERSRPDIIVSDVAMPGMYGTSALRALRENDSTKSIPLIFVTGLPVKNAFVKISAGGRFKEGRTDARGVFSATGFYGSFAAVAEHDGHFAFWRQ